MQKEVFALIILDVAEGGRADDRDPQDLQPDVPEHSILVTSSSPDARMIVDAVRPAADFIARPFAGEKLGIFRPPGRSRPAASGTRSTTCARAGRVYGHRAHHLGQPAMQKAMASIRRLAQTESTVLITGETGTGKSSSRATSIHSPRRTNPSSRSTAPTSRRRCSRASSSVTKRGAFTGHRPAPAASRRPTAATLFLDEFCELSFG